MKTFKRRDVIARLEALAGELNRLGAGARGADALALGRAVDDLSAAVVFLRADDWDLDMSKAPRGKRADANGKMRETFCLVWASGVRIARQDEHGCWRGVIGRPLTVQPTAWRPLPGEPDMEGKANADI